MVDKERDTNDHLSIKEIEAQGFKLHLSKSFQEVFLKDLESIVNELKLFFMPMSSLFLLLGSMGAGKTTFMKALIEKYTKAPFLGSPTFNLYYEYEIEQDKGKLLELVHMDLERVSYFDELCELGFEEMLYHKIIFIENFKTLFNYSLFNHFTLCLFQESAKFEEARNIQFLFYKKDKVCIT